MLDVRAHAWERWQAAAGPWRGWVACHVLAEPEIDGVSATRWSAPQTRTEELTPLLQGGGTAIILDLEPMLGVHVAAGVSALAHVVLVLPRWAYAQAVLPVDQLLWSLIEEARVLSTDIHTTNVAFVLDAERSKPIVRRAGDRRADNRYMLSAGDLPNLASLRAQGIRRVVKISRA